MNKLKVWWKKNIYWCHKEIPIIAPIVKKDLTYAEQIAIAIAPLIAKGALPMAINWAAFLKGLEFLPTIISTVEGIHGQQVAGATKQAMALQALTAITGAADSVLNNKNTEIANAASQLATAVINTTVADTKAVQSSTATQAAVTVANSVLGVVAAAVPVVTAVG